jgi:hypothetical protein
VADEPPAAARYEARIVCGIEEQRSTSHEDPHDHIIQFVADRAIRFHGDLLGMSLRFQFPEWMEFVPGRPRSPCTWPRRGIPGEDADRAGSA